MRKRTEEPTRVALSAILLLVVLLGCDSDSSPVAPSGTTLSISANPSSIGIQGSATLSLVILHSSGGPARTGTEISLSTNLGRVEPALVASDSGGRATATLFADGRSGSARVRATSGTVSAETTVSIQDGRPSASFSSQSNGRTVIFTDTSSGNPTAWVWNFGDASGTSSEQNPVYTYAADGTYTVTLTVTNAVGSDTTSIFVTVTE